MRLLHLLYEQGELPPNAITPAIWPKRPHAHSFMERQLKRMLDRGLIRLRFVPCIRTILLATRPTKVPPRKYYSISAKGYAIYEHHARRAAQAGLPYPVGTSRTCC